MSRVNTNAGADLADLGQLCTWLPSLSTQLHTQICLVPLPSLIHTHTHLTDSENQYRPNKTFLQAL